METVIHKTAKMWRDDPAMLPFRTSKCGDEYVSEVVSHHWVKVNCKDCLKIKEAPRNLPLTAKYKERVSEQRRILRLSRKDV